MLGSVGRAPRASTVEMLPNGVIGEGAGWALRRTRLRAQTLGRPLEVLGLRMKAAAFAGARMEKLSRQTGFGGGSLPAVPTALGLAMAFSPTSMLDPRAEAKLAPDPAPSELRVQVSLPHCMPRQGNQGQRLTLAFRRFHPPDRGDGWKSRCRGTGTCPNGFMLQSTAPAPIESEPWTGSQQPWTFTAFIRGEMEPEAAGGLPDAPMGSGWPSFSGRTVGPTVVAGRAQWALPQLTPPEPRSRLAW